MKPIYLVSIRLFDLTVAGCASKNETLGPVKGARSEPTVIATQPLEAEGITAVGAFSHGEQ